MAKNYIILIDKEVLVYLVCNYLGKYHFMLKYVMWLTSSKSNGACSWW